MGTGGTFDTFEFLWDAVQDFLEPPEWPAAENSGDRESMEGVTGISAASPTAPDRVGVNVQSCADRPEAVRRTPNDCLGFGFSGWLIQQCSLRCNW
jgi:hypothetical protein